MEQGNGIYEDGWSPESAVEAEAPGMFDDMTGELQRTRTALVREMDKGLAPDAFTKAEALLSAYDAALAGLEKARAQKNAE